MAEEIRREGHYAGYEGDYVRTECKYGSRWRLSWGAIFCGLFVTLAVFLVLHLLGAGIGISVLDIQDSGDNPEASTVGIVAGIWWLICTLVSLFIGGWVSGYLANMLERTASALHGFVLWSLMYVVMFWLVTTVLATMIGGTIGLIGKSIATAGQAASSQQGQQVISETMQSLGIDTDMIQQSIDQAVGPNTSEQNQSIVKSIQDYLQGNRTRENRQRLAQSISQDTDKTQQEADEMIRGIEQKAQQAKVAARETKEEAKEAGQKAVEITGGSLIGLAFVMILGAIVAILGAITGCPKCHAKSRSDTIHRHD